VGFAAEFAAAVPPLGLLATAGSDEWRLAWEGGGCFLMTNGSSSLGASSCSTGG